jgi:hypothetical protein
MCSWRTQPDDVISGGAQWCELAAGQRGRAMSSHMVYVEGAMRLPHSMDSGSTFKSDLLKIGLAQVCCRGVW